MRGWLQHRHLESNLKPVSHFKYCPMQSYDVFVESGKLTSAGSVNRGICAVGIGGTVYTMKSACVTRKTAVAARMKEVGCIVARFDLRETITTRRSAADKRV